MVSRYQKHRQASIEATDITLHLSNNAKVPVNSKFNTLLFRADARLVNRTIVLPTPKALQFHPKELS
jgi:hypothetical protein